MDENSGRLRFKLLLGVRYTQSDRGSIAQKRCSQRSLATVPNREFQQRMSRSVFLAPFPAIDLALYFGGSHGFPKRGVNDVASI